MKPQENNYKTAKSTISELVMLINQASNIQSKLSNDASIKSKRYSIGISTNL